MTFEPAYNAAAAARQPVRQEARPAADAREDGVVLTDLSLRPIAIDAGAIAILKDVSWLNNTPGSPLSIPREIVEASLNRARSEWSGIRVRFRGKQYEYYCAMYQVEPHDGILRAPLVALHLYRVSSANNAIHLITRRFGLTRREEEVLTGISVGLTSKEVAQRLDISPNTVKTYIRTLMVKMGVTTRAAIVGKLLACDVRTKTDA